MTPRGSQTRARLIEATIRVVQEVGYARATTRAIAETAGVAEGTIYRHFPDKQRLFFAAIQERNQTVFAWVSQLPELAGTSTVQANLTESLRQLAGLRNDLLPLELALLTDPDLAREHRTAMANAGPDLMALGPPGVIAAYLAAEQRLGRIQSGIDAGEAAIVILATLFGIALVPDDPEAGSVADRIATAVAMLMSGLAPRPG